MKTIIVPTDFSSTALNAARYAVDIAKETGALIHLIHIYQVPLIYMDAPLPVNQTNLEEEIKSDMEEVREGLIHYAGGKIDIKTQMSKGVFFEKFQEICKSIQPYLVIMGSQGTTAADRFFLGSHAVQTMKHLNWPVIAVPSGAIFLGIDRIGFACDFNKVIETIPVEKLKKFMKDFKAEMHVLNTGKERGFEPDVVFGSAMLQEMIFDIKPHYHFITKPDTVEGIMQLAKENDIDMLVVLPKQHNIIDIITHKSFTKKLVLNSYLPVMALHN